MSNCHVKRRGRLPSHHVNTKKQTFLLKSYMVDYKRLFLEGHTYYLTMVTHRRNAIVVLPDHIHMIITPQNVHDYPKIVRAIKYNFTIKINHNEEQSMARHKKGLKPIWQKRYYEHTIRDEKDYLRCLEYMKHNPIKHGLVENVNDWEYSSF